MSRVERLYLCLDQGGHASRALVVAEQGEVLSRGAQEVQTFHSGANRVEHRPEEIIASLKEAIGQAIQPLGARVKNIVAAGLATQRSTIVCWDRTDGMPLSPVISWQDRRAAEWLEQFAHEVATVKDITGLVLSPHYGASKLRWCLDHLPAVTTAAQEGRLAAAPLASFLLFHLLKEQPLLIDPANAGRTLLFNRRTANWDPALLKLFDIPQNVLPRCVANRHAFGTLPIGPTVVPLQLLTGDQPAALFARARPGADTAFINIGTGAFIQRVADISQGVATGLLNSIAYRDEREIIYVSEGTVNGAGAAIAWVAQELEIPDIDAKLHEWLSAVAEPVLFLNGIAGLGAPFWIADFPSRFVGTSGVPSMAVAVVESIVFLLLVNFERMQNEVPLKQLVVSGGLAHYDGLCQRLADLSRLPVYRPQEHEATALGLAYLLADAPDRWPSAVGDVGFMPRVNPALAARYSRWRVALTQALTARD